MVLALEGPDAHTPPGHWQLPGACGFLPHHRTPPAPSPWPPTLTAALSHSPCLIHPKPCRLHCEALHTQRTPHSPLCMACLGPMARLCTPRLPVHLTALDGNSRPSKTFSGPSPTPCTCWKPSQSPPLLRENPTVTHEAHTGSEGGLVVCGGGPATQKPPPWSQCHPVGRLHGNLRGHTPPTPETCGSPSPHLTHAHTWGSWGLPLTAVPPVLASCRKTIGNLKPTNTIRNSVQTVFQNIIKLLRKKTTQSSQYSYWAQ